MSTSPVPLPNRPAAGDLAPGVPFRGAIQALLPNGRIRVEPAGGGSVDCDWLNVGGVRPMLSPGDAVLVVADTTGQAVMLGLIGPYSREQAPEALELRANQTLSLKCGESSIDLRADGKVVIKGDDVLVRAKGTKRIRAGSVSIN